jgi:hypothetical protein
MYLLGNKTLEQEMKKIDTNSPLISWQVAKKTKSLKAKPLVSIMVDKNVLSKFLIDTLEGKEPLGDGVVICIGESNDAWQQMPKKLLQKYDVVAIDNDGWMICDPKPDNSVSCIEYTDDEPFYIIGLYGEQTPEGLIQKGEKGDFICRSRTDLTDNWIVKRKIFINTYNIIG